MTIGILGGAFDPIHIGHLWLAYEVGKRHKFSKVVFVPSKIPPHKTHVAKETERWDMVKMAISNNPFFEISSVEIEKPEVSYTVNTIPLLQKQFSEPLAWIIGSDNVRELPRWHQWKKILSLCDLVIGQRAGIGIEIMEVLKPLLEKKEYERLCQNFVSMPSLSISSSELRTRYALGMSNRYLVPEAVDEYILDKKIYMASR